jgi:hypothetical protein
MMTQRWRNDVISMTEIIPSETPPNSGAAHDATQRRGAMMMQRRGARRTHVAQR